MSSQTLGESTSGVEVTHVSSHGIWLLAGGREYFMSYEDFPWFKNATIKAVLNVKESTPGHFHWPELDVDLTPEIIEHLERFPLTAKDA